MSKYKAGDKVVMQIMQDDCYGDYKVGNETCSWYNSQEFFDKVTEPLSEYTEPLEVEASRLIKENAKLKAEIESAKATGQQEAWELAKKIVLHDTDGGFSASMMLDIFEYSGAYQIIKTYQYNEAAEKVAEWERQKNEICVGDIVSINDVNRCGVVICDDFNVVSVITHNGSVIIRAKDKCKKTGRHIDVNAFLKQIS